ncbi:helix-turn-helix domain-containing protein [Halorhodospira halochloris]|uniref:helix-turn-helix domain-containing protein n=1 Tax=Halorhodospira halochloris TaxID=1052 RepID=UPI001EE85AE3|nr:helix-turn-helix transcriptional regulator [Halorhodospira halochloris]MCG5531714.1 helix-turn-helix domain-containing protein [Halorhodospira halochloris]
MSHEQIRFAVAMRMGRAALGLNQQEFADLLGVAKSTVARTETLEISMRAETLMAMIRVLRERGVEMDLIGEEQRISIEVNPEALAKALERLADDDKRRSDRQRKGL